MDPRNKDQTAYRPRIADHELAWRLASAGAVVIEGPRVCGKTTTTRQAAASEVLMDSDPRVGETMAVDPALLLAAHPKRPRGTLRHLAGLAVAIVAVVLIGCDPRATDHRVIGIVIFDHPHYPDWPLPQIPETATAGVPLEMIIWTANSCDYRQGDTKVTVLGRSAVVIPYDILTTYEGGFPQTIDEHPGFCWQVPGTFEHKATVVFEEPGTAEIILLYSTDGGHLPEYFKADGRKVYTVEVSPAGG